MQPRPPDTAHQLARRQLAASDAGLPGTYERALADFGTATFTDVKLNGYVIGSFDIARYNYLIPAPNGGSHLLATSSPLSVSGDDFTLAYRRMS
jgi:hypothetical protein